MLEKSGGAPGRTEIISPQQWLGVVQPAVTADGIPPRPALPLSNYLAPARLPANEGLAKGMEVPVDANARNRRSRLKQSEVEALYEELLAAPKPHWRKFPAFEAQETAATPAPAPNVSLVYFIASDAGPIKIGKAISPERRLKELQTGHPAKLTILATCGGGREQEKRYHARFAAHRLSGEWFARCAEIEAEITRLTTNTSEVSHG